MFQYFFRKGNTSKFEKNFEKKNFIQKKFVKIKIYLIVFISKACQKDNVKRVVLTSCADAMFGELSDAESRLYSESDWPNEENINDPYTKSKLLAEQAAWSFVEDQIRAGRSCFELAVINPTFVLGPPLSPNECTSMAIFMMSFNNDQPQDDQVLPDMLIPVCDVRDVALAVTGFGLNFVPNIMLN